MAIEMLSFLSIAVLWFIRFVFRTVNVLMVASLVLSNIDFSASIFETQDGKRTCHLERFSHVMNFSFFFSCFFFFYLSA